MAARRRDGNVETAAEGFTGDGEVTNLLSRPRWT
jgi:hypothetical protein